METRYKTIVLKKESMTFEVKLKEGTFFDISEEDNEKLVITACEIATQNYANPPIPEGYKYVEGEWDTGFVIERSLDGSQFVWIPVGSLYPDGTLDGEHFSEKFGRRNYRKDEFSHNMFYEELNDELLEQIDSVEKYGGFYISRYYISKKLKRKPQSVKGFDPWGNITFEYAKEIASIFENNQAVKSHLTFGAEYDSVLAWLIKSKAKTLKGIAVDFSEWENYWKNPENVHEVCETESNEKWCPNKIYDFAGNIIEWTQEKEAIIGGTLRYVGEERVRRVCRGGKFCDKKNYPGTKREGYYTDTRMSDSFGFRIVLCIK